MAELGSFFLRIDRAVATRTVDRPPNKTPPPSKEPVSKARIHWSLLPILTVAGLFSGMYSEWFLWWRSFDVWPFNTYKLPFLASVSFGLSLAAVLWFYGLIRSWKTVMTLLALAIAVPFLAAFMAINSSSVEGAACSDQYDSKECWKQRETLQKELNEHVKQVRLSARLTISPVCLVVEEHDYSPMLERVLQKGQARGPKQRRVLELNPKHPLISRMRERYLDSSQDPMLKNAAQLLFGLALLAEGSELPDTMRFNRAASELLAQAV